ncbi:MAG: ADP-ribosylglycohydrolase family protein, partial [Oscillospiraceae bacterium]|nr:ADP-ribosylglycohydrolase family protein [Oscillospiraceae bacterium]
GYIPAAAFVHIINLLAKNESISVLDAVADSVVVMRKIFKESDQLVYFHRLMEKAAYLAESSDNDIDAIHKLGEGWVAEETLAIAVYCAIKYQNDFEKAVCTAVNHNGDSDSTGAVCGNILGAYLGLSNIPQKYKSDLEFYNVLMILADDLLDDCRMSEYGDFYDEAWSEKYIKKTYKA